MTAERVGQETSRLRYDIDCAEVVIASWFRLGMASWMSLVQAMEVHCGGSVVGRRSGAWREYPHKKRTTARALLVKKRVGSSWQ